MHNGFESMWVLIQLETLWLSCFKSAKYCCCGVTDSLAGNFDKVVPFVVVTLLLEVTPPRNPNGLLAIGVSEDTADDLKPAKEANTDFPDSW